MTNYILYLLLALGIWTGSAVTTKGNRCKEIIIIVLEIQWLVISMIKKIKILLELLIKDLFNDYKENNKNRFLSTQVEPNQELERKKISESNYYELIEDIYLNSSRQTK